MWQPPNNLEDQCFNGIYETDDCWDFSGVSILEIKLLQLFPTFSPVAKQFFISNGYCDVVGNFALSRRYIAIQSGVKNNGNNQIKFWDDVTQYGMIPRSMLDFTPSMANDPDYPTFVTDFFNPQAITSDMENLAQQFNTYVTVSAIYIQLNLVPQALTQTPLQIGIPIPKVVSNWNQPVVQWDGSTIVQHAIVLLGINPDGTKTILDSYIPWVKQLSANYLMPYITQPTITVNNIATEQIPRQEVNWLLAILKKIGLY